MTTPLLAQVTTSSTGNITLYLEALNYNVLQLPALTRSTLNGALNAAALVAGITTLGANIPLTNDTLSLATGALITAGVLPLKVTAAAVAVCQTDSIPAGTYTGVGVALAGALLPLCTTVHGITAQVRCSLPRSCARSWTASQRSAAERSMLCYHAVVCRF